MSKNNANESALEPSASPGPAGDAAPQETRRRPDEAAAPVAAEKLMAWAGQEARPRRRQDREAGPSDKQVYVPPVTLPPNREHHAIDQQKIQVAPSLLKGIDERNRPTMRRIPVMEPAGGRGNDGDARALALGGRAPRIVGVGQGVWPPPEDDAARAGAQPRAQRLQPTAAPVALPAGVHAARPPAAVPGAPATAQGGVPVWSPPRPSRLPIVPLAALVLLGGAAAVGVFFLRQPSPPRDDASVSAVRDAPRASEPAVEPAPPPAAEQAPRPTVAEPAPPPTPAATVFARTPPDVAPAPPPEPAPVEVAQATPAPSPPPSKAARSPDHAARPAATPRKPAKASAAPEDVYDSAPSKAQQPAPAPPSTAATSTPPTTTAPPRPF